MFKWMITLFGMSTLLSCGIPTIEYISDPEIIRVGFSVKDDDGDLRLLFEDDYKDENPTFEGYLVLYKFFKQDGTNNLLALQTEFANLTVSNLTPDYLISSKGFFELTNGETNIFRPSIRLTRSSQETSEILITMVFSELIEELNNPDITSSEISEPYFYLQNNDTEEAITTFLGDDDGQIEFYRGIRDVNNANKFHRFSDFYNLDLNSAAVLQDLAHLNLAAEVDSVVLEIVFFVFGYGEEIGEAASFSSPIGWETVKDFYQW